MFKQKYLKYKTKYHLLKNKLFGGKRKYIISRTKKIGINISGMSRSMSREYDKNICASRDMIDYINIIPNDNELTNIYNTPQRSIDPIMRYYDKIKTFFILKEKYLFTLDPDNSFKYLPLAINFKMSDYEAGFSWRGNSCYLDSTIMAMFHSMHTDFEDLILNKINSNHEQLQKQLRSDLLNIRKGNRITCNIRQILKMSSSNAGYPSDVVDLIISKMMGKIVKGPTIQYQYDKEKNKWEESRINLDSIIISSIQKSITIQNVMDNYMLSYDEGSTMKRIFVNHLTSLPNTLIVGCSTNDLSELYINNEIVLAGINYILTSMVFSPCHNKGGHYVCAMRVSMTRWIFYDDMRSNFIEMSWNDLCNKFNTHQKLDLLFYSRTDMNQEIENIDLDEVKRDNDIIVN